VHSLNSTSFVTNSSDVFTNICFQFCPRIFLSLVKENKLSTGQNRFFSLSLPVEKEITNIGIKENLNIRNSKLVKLSNELPIGQFLVQVGQVLISPSEHFDHFSTAEVPINSKLDETG
jgi:hypothetical protein